MGDPTTDEAAAADRRRRRGRRRDLLHRRRLVRRRRRLVGQRRRVAAVDHALPRRPRRGHRRASATAGMVPGLWLEPEVVGVRSPMADQLPRRGVPAARRRSASSSTTATTSTCATPPPSRTWTRSSTGSSTTSASASSSSTTTSTPARAPTSTPTASATVCCGHNRAHLDWLDGVLDRHPDARHRELRLRRHAHGLRAAVAAAAAVHLATSRTSCSYPPIAAAAPMSMLPEQAASWAYPQPEMTDEEIAFCLVTGLLGRFYLSGHLDRDDRAPSATRWRAAVAAAKRLRAEIAARAPVLAARPARLGRPWIALGLRTDGRATSSRVWRPRRPGGRPRSRFPHLRRRATSTSTTVFPARPARLAHRLGRRDGNPHRHARHGSEPRRAVPSALTATPGPVGIEAAHQITPITSEGAIQ